MAVLWNRREVCCYVTLMSPLGTGTGQRSSQLGSRLEEVLAHVWPI
jgi:hypothetical protein